MSNRGQKLLLYKHIHARDIDHFHCMCLDMYYYQIHLQLRAKDIVRLMMLANRIEFGNKQTQMQQLRFCLRFGNRIHNPEYKDWHPSI